MLLTVPQKKQTALMNKWSWSVTEVKHDLPSNSVNVGFYRCGEIKVDDISNILEVHSSGDSILLILRPLKTSDIIVNMSQKIHR